MKTASQLQQAVRTLAARGKGLREIARLLDLSRNTVRRILRHGEPAPTEGPSCDQAMQARLKAAFALARGNVVRVKELLAEDGADIPYSTLTRWARQAGLRVAPRRAGEYHFVAGEEMQHDTSPHRVDIGGKTVKAQCAALVLSYSRRLFFQYYARFSRLEAKAFLLDAVRFMEGSCPVCVIDNTSVILAAGSGADAVVAPEMAAFAATLGFRFLAHRIGHPDRKGRIERPFHWIENSFLPGRSFSDYADVNRQAIDWCRRTANAKPKRGLGMSPEAAFVIEKPHLQPLPSAPPPVYELLERVVDLSGFVSVETNRYSCPESLVGRHVTVYKFADEIRIAKQGATIAIHRRLIGRRDAKSVLPGHHVLPAKQRRGPTEEEALLKEHHPSLDAYVAGLKSRSHGWGRRALRRLLELKRTYPFVPFLAAVEQALQYGMFDLGRLESLILKQVAGDFFALGLDDDDA
jgi:hypothetical protein